MVVRIIIVVVVTIVHALTPHWFLNDFLKLGDWLMLFLALLSLLVYKAAEKDKRINILSILLSLITAIYFITTTRMITPDVGNERVVYRLQLIYKGFKSIQVQTGEVIEKFNAILIVLNVVIGIIILAQFYRMKNKTS